jgi:hypothetical protein
LRKGAELEEFLKYPCDFENVNKPEKESFFQGTYFVIAVRETSPA